MVEGENIRKIRISEVNIGNLDDKYSDILLMEQLVRAVDELNEALYALNDEAVDRQARTIQNIQTNLQASTRSFAHEQVKQRDVEETLRANIPDYLSPEELAKLEASLRRKEQLLQEYNQRIEEMKRQDSEETQQAVEDRDELEEGITLDRDRIERMRRNRDSMFQNINTVVDKITQSAPGKVIIAGTEVATHGVQNIGGAFASRIGGAAADALDISDPMSRSMLGAGASWVGDALSSFMTLGRGAAGLAGTFGGFTVAIAGAVAAIGIFESFLAIADVQKMKRAMLAGAPGAADNIIGSLYDDQTTRDFKRRIRQNMFARSGDELNQLLSASMFPEMGAEVNDDSIANLAIVTGKLEDVGLDKDITQKSVRTMYRDFHVSLEEAEMNVMNLAKSAKYNAVDMGTYVDKMTELSKQMYVFGYTVEDVDATVSRYMDKTLANGRGLNPEEAFGAAQMEMGMRQRLSTSAAAYIAMNHGQNLVAETNKAGFGSGGHSLKQIHDQFGPFGDILNANLIRYGKFQDRGGDNATASLINSIVGTQVEGLGGLKGTPEANHMMRGTLTANVASSLYGMDLQYGRSAKETAFVDELMKGTFKDKELGNKIKEFSKNTTDLLGDLQKHFGDMFTNTYTELLGRQKVLLTFEELLDELRDALAGVFIPILQGLLASLSGISEFLLQIGKNSSGNAVWDMMNWDKILAKSHNAAVDKYSDVVLHAADMNIRGDLKTLVTPSETGRFLTRELVTTVPRYHDKNYDNPMSWAGGASEAAAIRRAMYAKAHPEERNPINDYNFDWDQDLIDVAEKRRKAREEEQKTLDALTKAAQEQVNQVKAHEDASILGLTQGAAPIINATTPTSSGTLVATGGTYQQLAMGIAKKYGLPEDLFLSQIYAESSFNPNARSSSGAMGLGQLMPGTAKELGVTNPWDPAQNLTGAAKYMRQLIDRRLRQGMSPDQAYRQAVIDYNQGPNRKGLTSEASRYVSKVYGNRPKFGSGGSLAQGSFGSAPGLGSVSPSGSSAKIKSTVEARIYNSQGVQIAKSVNKVEKAL